MKAITVEPKKPRTARYEDFPEPEEHEGSVLVEAVAVGVCGTDVEIVEGKYGWAPPGATRLVLGHESLGRVIDPGPRSSLKKGDLVVGIVRRPDPVPCPNCAVGEWDMCTNGQYTERGSRALPNATPPARHRNLHLVDHATYHEFCNTPYAILRRLRRSILCSPATEANRTRVIRQRTTNTPARSKPQTLRASSDALRTQASIGVGHSSN